MFNNKNYYFLYNGFIISFIFLVLFRMLLCCFKNTQLYIFHDTFIGFISSLIYPFALYLLPGIFRIPALRSNHINNQKCLYLVSKVIQFI